MFSLHYRLHTLLHSCYTRLFPSSTDDLMSPITHSVIQRGLSGWVDGGTGSNDVYPTSLSRGWRKRRCCDSHSYPSRVGASGTFYRRCLNFQALQQNTGRYPWHYNVFPCIQSVRKLAFTYLLSCAMRLQTSHETPMSPHVRTRCSSVTSMRIQQQYACVEQGALCRKASSQ